MNCKPGDLAVIVRCGYRQNIGGLVEVRSRYRCEQGEWFVMALSPLMTNRGPVSSMAVVWMDDADLRPIRDQDGEDETFEWAGKPEGVTA